MRHASTLTGKRRIAFASYADEPRLPALLALLRDLALSSPAVCEDFLVLHPGLPDAAFDAARRLHPRIVPRRTAPAGSTLDALETLDALDALGPEDGPGYDTVVALEPGTVIRRNIAPLLRRRERVVPFQPADDDGGDGGGDDGGDGPAGGAADAREPSDHEFYAAYCALRGAKAPELFLHCALPLLEADQPDPELVRRVGTTLYQQGRYDEAVRVLAPTGGDPGLARNQEALGSALMAVSRYDEARTHLLLAAADPAVAPRAYTQLARLAWLLGEDEEAHAYALRGLDADPTDAALRTLHRRTSPGTLPAGGRGETPGPAAEQTAHVALFADGKDNAGDKVLPEAVRRCFGPDTGASRWHAVPVHRLVTERVLAELNARRGVIVGGGGLFLPDTWPNGNSGWQWNVPGPMLERLTAPLAVFAVGFNVFDGQHFGASRLAESLRAVVAKSVFFGLRNHGSVERVRELLPPDLADRVRYQPCPTTVLRHLIPGWRDPAPAEREDVILLNCAYDRAGLRFGHDYGHFLAELAAAVRRLGRYGEVRYAPHAPSDERFVHDLRREHGITLPVEPLYDLSNEDLLAVYRRVRLVIGMRGHATMIPFGCGTPALSLISHPKLAYFLADVARPEWGVSVHDADLGAVLTERAAGMLDDHEAAVADVHERQEELLRVTRANAAEVARAFSL